MEILKISISLLMIFGCAIIASDTEKNRTLFNCEATVFSAKLNSTIKCVDSISFSGLGVVAKCLLYSNNESMRIYWAFISDLAKVLSHKLTCISSAPLSTEIYFRDGVPEIQSVNLRHERVKSQLGSSTQEYIMTLLVPDPSNRWSYFASKYKIFHKEDRDSAVNVLFTRKWAVFPCVPYSLSEDRNILINREIITIPCLSFGTTTLQLFRRNATEDGKKIEEELKVDNNSLSYDPMEGFKINTTLLTNSEGDYTCYCNDENRKDSVSYSIGKYKTNGPQNHTLYVYHPEHNFDIITGSSKTSFDLECVNHLKNVTIEGELTSNHYRNHSKYLDSKSTQISEFPFNVTIKHYKGGISSPYYFASAKVPYLNTSERTALKIFVTYINEYAEHKASLRCTDGNITLHNWNIDWIGGNLSKDHINPLMYYNQVFFCSSAGDDLELRHMECETPTECRSFLKCLETKEVAGKPHPKVNCHKDIVIKKGKPYVFQQIFISKDGDCDCSTRRFKSGIVQCLSSSFNVLQPYFVGFDNELYVTTEPPLHAILKLRILSTESDLYTNGRQKLLCEAHQFFYEHGIQWDFKYPNGTSISPDFLQYVPEKNSDFLYPKSNIEVSFAKVTEVLIVCLAPVFGAKQDWQNTTTTLKLKKSLPPEIDSKDFDVYFDANKKHQSITCQANGLPQPQIHWIRNNEVIDDESRLVDSGFRKVLLFPTYNESLSGDYICQASNIFGNKSLRFQVFTASSPDVNGSLSLWIILTITGLCLVILISFVFFVIYLTIQKSKKYQDMKQVIGLLNGNAENTDNPIELPFNTTLELEKHSFSFDKGKLLGKGEFGEVYKGRIEGRDGWVAFKTLSQNCSISHTKALVAEIKMLMYVGEHPNLVELIGVYRKEIKQGILYLALEFCDLGSLESYLRSYKHLFIKCPIINSYIKSDSVQRPRKEIGELQLYSMKTLIKWCYQIANAMEYLGTKNVVHSDLAARNVLLTAEANAKVTDFGLSRRTYNYTEYVKTAKDALPWRWLALESLLTNTFSRKSDVWAYGITLWEMFSLGEMPYPGMNPTLEFVEELKTGLRNLKPNYASQELYQVMSECWHPDANQRPSFSALRIIFQSAFSQNEANIDSKISQDSNLEEIAKELSAAVYCDLEEL